MTTEQMLWNRVFKKPIKGAEKFYKYFRIKSIKDLSEWVFLIDQIADCYNLKGKKLIDIGAGYGLISILFALKGAEVVALDMDKESCEQLKVVLKHGFRDIKVKVKLASALTIPYENESFDIAFANEVISHASNPSQFIKESARVLHKKGCLILSDTNKNCLINRFYLAKKKYKALDQYFYYNNSYLVLSYVHGKSLFVKTKDLNYIIKNTYGMTRKEINNIIDNYESGDNYRKLIKKYKPPFPFRDPDTGYYYEHFFSPVELSEICRQSFPFKSVVSKSAVNSRFRLVAPLLYKNPFNCLIGASISSKYFVIAQKA